MYFKNIKENDEVFGLIYGPGKVSNIMGDGFYAFMVTYNNGYEVPYTCDGVPGWGSFNIQTVFYKNDVDITQLDLAPSEKVLTPKKIIKLRDKSKLMMKCPSGNWLNIKECPGQLVEKYLEGEKFHLFKKDND